MERTIIDILRKGNQELFHSSMIAWLLDPTKDKEHGIGNKFIEKLVEKIGRSDLIEVLKTGTPLKVRTEVPGYKSRYDIEIKIGDKTVIFENKTKSIGESSQLQWYKKNNENLILVALGFCDVSFSLTEDDKSNFPFLTYYDILEILNCCPKVIDGDPFKILREQYRIFLDRELKLLQLITDCYVHGKINLQKDIQEKTSQDDLYSENDKRFINLFFLGKIQEYLMSKVLWQGMKWTSDKNMISGVWMATLNGLPKTYQISPQIQNLFQQDEGIWFHVELGEGVFASKHEDLVGNIQLKCWLKTTNKYDFFNEFIKICQPKQELNESMVKRKSGSSFYLIKRNIFKKDLVFPEFEKILIDFMKRFGGFDQTDIN